MTAKITPYFYNTPLLRITMTNNDGTIYKFGYDLDAIDFTFIYTMNRHCINMTQFGYAGNYFREDMRRKENQNYYPDKYISNLKAIPTTLYLTDIITSKGENIISCP